MAQQTIRFRIRPDGRVDEQVEGLVGSACEQLTDRIEAQAQLGKMWGPFDNTLPAEPYVLSATIPYAFDATGIDLGASRVATQTSYVEFQGRTEYGDNSRIPFHVSSADWQASMASTTLRLPNRWPNSLSQPWSRSGR